MARIPLFAQMVQRTLGRWPRCRREWDPVLTGRDPTKQDPNLPVGRRIPLANQLSEAIVRVREMILRGDLVPGQRVAEAPLAEELGMSRTPVRQALPLLAQEGLLTER